MCYLEEFEVIRATLVGFESSSDSFHLSPDIDESFTLPGSGDARILQVGKHEIEFRTHEKIHTFFEVPGVSPPVFLSQGIPFSYGLGFCFGKIEDTPKLFFKEKDFLYGSSSVNFDHLRDEEVVLFSPPIHMFEQSPFHLPEFFSVESPVFPF
jgi:hypothetical protein